MLKNAGGSMKQADKIIIIDDEGKEHTYTNFQDFVNYADSFDMSFLPDNFSYRIEEEA